MRAYCGLGPVLDRDAKSLFFLGLRLQAKNQTLIPTAGFIVWHNDSVLKDNLREILNYSNKRSQSCTNRVLVVK